VSVVRNITCTWELVHFQYVNATAPTLPKDPNVSLSHIHRARHRVDARNGIVSCDCVHAT